MSPTIATLLFVLLIAGLFWLDRATGNRTSPALWIPILWLGLSGSRSVSQWLQMGPVMSTDQYLEGSPLDRLVYMGLLAIGIGVVVTRRKQVGKLLSANGPIVLFFLYCALSLLWSDFPDVAFKRWIKAVGDFLMVLLVLTETDSTMAIKTFLARTGYILIPASVLLVKYYPALGRGYDPWDGTAHYVGVTTNKNTLGVICLLFGLACVWGVLSTSRGQRRLRRVRQLIPHAVILSMVMWLFWKANSMTSLASFLMGGALIIMTSLDGIGRRPWAVHLLVATIISACVCILFLGIGSGVLTTIGRNPTLTDRTAVWALILKFVTNPLLGTGFESFWLGPRLSEIWSVYAWGPTEAHNGYIEIYLNLGWTGVVALACVLATGYRTTTVAVRRSRPAASLMLAYFVVGIVYNFTEAAFFRMMAPAWIATLLAMTRVPGRLSSGEAALKREEQSVWFGTAPSVFAGPASV